MTLEPTANSMLSFHAREPSSMAKAVPFATGGGEPAPERRGARRGYAITGPADEPPSGRNDPNGPGGPDCGPVACAAADTGGWDARRPHPDPAQRPPIHRPDLRSDADEP